MNYRPFIVSWNTTRRCNLRCAHCYLDARELESGGEGELTTGEGVELIDSIAALNPRAFLVLTGGEPLLREDILELASVASSRGLIVLLGTNGILLGEGAARKLKGSGVEGIGVSIHSLDARIHDSFTGLEGSLSRVTEGIAACRREGLDFQVQTVARRENLDEIPAIIGYSREVGAKAFNLFFLVCTGRGQGLTDLTAEQYEEALSLLMEEHMGSKDMIIRARCAPHFKRVVRQRSPGDFPAGAEMSGCLAATHYCRVTPEGDVTPCPYMPLRAGNLRETSFESIWQGSHLFRTLRTSALKGKCGLCEFNEICGGCRARALAMKGDPMEEDPWCLYEPSEVEARPEREDEEPEWTREAEERLGKIPFFIRGYVKRAIIGYAKREGISAITPEILHEVKRKVKPH
ncbi:MAG: radical SAM protein [Nitrospinota bacterium]